MTKRETARLKRLEAIKNRQAILVEATESQQEATNAVVPIVVPAEQEAALQAHCARFAPRTGGSVDEVSDFKAKALICRVYGSVLNPRLRLIEFKDGTHGRMWVRRDELPMTNWVVWCKLDPEHPNDYMLHGQYNARGIRTR